jgi:ABC-type Zn uptake system ZnuABC Zn-binding protein ZnuA
MSHRRIGSVVLLTLAAAVAAAPGCKPASSGATWPEGKPRVVATFAPIYCFAASVAGPDATVHTLMTDKGPHDAELTQADAEKVRGAQLILMNGLGLDDKNVERIKGSIGGDAKAVALADAIPKDRLHHHDEDEGHDKDKKDAHDHDHGEYDPHVWLGLPEAVLMVGKVRDELTALDPAHADGYRQRAADTVARLNKLHADGKAMLKDKKERKLVSFHESLGYFAPALDLKIAGVIEPQANVEPGSPWLTQLLKTCQDEHVRLIATEPQYSTKTGAQVLLTELKRKVPDAAFVEIDPIETAPPDELKPDYYERKMRENIENLAKALR